MKKYDVLYCIVLYICSPVRNHDLYCILLYNIVYMLTWQKPRLVFADFACQVLRRHAQRVGGEQHQAEPGEQSHSCYHNMIGCLRALRLGYRYDELNQQCYSSPRPAPAPGLAWVHVSGYAPGSAGRIDCITCTRIDYLPRTNIHIHMR